MIRRPACTAGGAVFSEHKKGAPALSRSPAFGHLLALAVSIVWGTTYISTKVLLEAFHPVEILIFRFVLAWAILFLCAPKPHYSLLENYALTFSMASTVGLIVSSAPMFTALLLWLCRRTTRPGASFFVGFVLAMAGIALISLAEGNPLTSIPSAVCWPWAPLSVGASTVCVWSPPIVRV